SSQTGKILSWQQAFALHALALQLAVTADRLGPFASTLFRRFFVVASEFHLAEDAFPLHLLFERFERLIDVVVANDDLQARLLVKWRALLSEPPRHVHL